LTEEKDMISGLRGFCFPHDQRVTSRPENQWKRHGWQESKAGTAA